MYYYLLKSSGLVFAHMVCNFALSTVINKIITKHKNITAMNDIDTINPCALRDNEIPHVNPRVNSAFNILGIMFLVSFLAYVAMHCL